MDLYRFYLRDSNVTTEWTEIEEPDGWDGLEITLLRSDTYTGFENVYSDNISFVESGARFLQACFDLYLFDALIDFKWEYYCNGSLEDSFYGSINMITYVELNGVVSVKIEESSFSRKLMNRLDTVVDFSSNVSIGGAELDPLTPIELPMHSKSIALQGQFYLDDFLSDYTETGVNDESFNAIYLPSSILSDEYGALKPPSILFDLNPTLPYSWRWAFTAPVDGDYTIDYNVQGFIEETTDVTRTFTYVFGIVCSNFGKSITIIPDTGYTQTGGTITIPISVSGSQTINLLAGQSIVLASRIYNSSPSRSAILRQNIETLSIKISSTSVYESSVSNSYKIYEVLNRVVESITDRKDAIRSEFFGRTDSYPKSYDENGCGSWLASLNGKMIRNFINPDLTPVSYSTTFNQLFDALDCLYSIGFRIEEENGLNYLRIEPKEYFYNSQSIMQFSNVADLQKSISVKDIYNNFDVGYEKWELEEVNGIDEINTLHHYSLPISTGNTKLAKISKFIAGAYAIEYTRRQQFAKTTTTDWRYDDDNFFIALSRIDQTFDTLVDDPFKLEGVSYPHTYLAGSVPERDEAFDYVNNYLVPSTGYNIRLSPTRMAMNWHPVLMTSIDHDVNKNVNFQSGTGNVYEEDKLIDACEPTIEGIIQNQNINRDIFESYKRYAFFKPVLYVFEYPGTFADFRYLRLNSNKSIEFSCESGNFIHGFIKEVNFMPNGEDGGILKITAKESGLSICTGGAFDESFDESFDIGEC